MENLSQQLLLRPSFPVPQPDCPVEGLWDALNHVGRVTGLLDIGIGVVLFGLTALSVRLFLWGMRYEPKSPFDNTGYLARVTGALAGCISAGIGLMFCYTGLLYILAPEAYAFKEITKILSIN